MTFTIKNECEYTKYAQGKDKSSYPRWWFRSLDGYNGPHTSALYGGGMWASGVPSKVENKHGVRPAFWLDISKDFDTIVLCGIQD